MGKLQRRWARRNASFADGTEQFSGIGEAVFGISEERLVDDADVVKGGEAFGLWQALAGIIDGFILSKANGG